MATLPPPVDASAPSSIAADDVDLEQRRQRVLELSSELAQARSLLRRVRANYAAVERSRFSRLRSLWMLTKAFLGFGSSRDLFLSTSGTAALEPEPEILESGPDLQTVRRAFESRISSFTSADPLVSIIIPAYNHCQTTLGCLFSIAATGFESLKVEIVVVDDASYDETSEAMAQIPGIVAVRNERNMGFVNSCNRGAELARGQLLCFLNNDTQVRNGWLDYLVSAIAADDSLGAVGSKLLYPDGRLQEVGNIVWKDGTGWNFGRLGDPLEPQYNFMRQVDYCSGACLLVRADAFHAVGGFNTMYAPAYYEDVDLCFALREKGFKVAVDPRSEVVHFEGITSGTATTSGTKRYQDVNRPKFERRWRHVLAGHFENSPSNVYLAARRQIGARCIVVVDSYVPMHNRDAGSDRMLKILKILRRAGYRVVFVPDNMARIEPYATQVQSLGVEFLYHAAEFRTTPLDRVREAVRAADVVWISRPALYQKWAPVVRKEASVPVIYDTVDLHYVRERREAELHASDGSNRWKSTEQMELAAARDADAVITVTDEEKEVLESAGISHVHVVPTIHEACITEPADFERTAGLLFIGSYAHPPNVHAARRLVKEIMPSVWRTLPGVRVTLLGADPPADLLQLRSENVDIPGFVADVGDYFRKSRLFVAPLQFGAGHKGKIGQSLSYALPVITTAIGAEGYGLADGESFRKAETNEDFARSISALYEDRDAWTRLARNSLSALQPFSAAQVATSLLAALDSAVATSGRIR